MKIAQRVSSAIAVCLLSIILFFVGSFKAFAYTTIGAEIPVNCLGVSDDNTHIYTIYRLKGFIGFIGCIFFSNTPFFQHSNL